MAKITLSNIKGYIQGNFRKVLDDFGELPEHIVHQAKWRLNQVKIKSPKCYEEDKCQHCGCQISAKVFEDRGCSNDELCYPKMMNEIEWESFKLEEDIIKTALYGNNIYKTLD